MADKGQLTVGIIELFSTGLQGFRIVASSIRVRAEYDESWRRMRIQQARLRVWGENWGIEEHSGVTRGSGGYEKLHKYLKTGIKVGNDVLDALNGIMEAFLSAERKGSVAKHGEASDTSELADRDIRELIVGQSYLPMTKARLDKSRRAVSYLSRCSWVINDHHTYIKLLLKVRAFIDDLHNLSPLPARNMMARALISDLLGGLDDATALQRFHDAALKDASDYSGPSGGAFSPSYHELAKAAKLRAKRNHLRTATTRLSDLDGLSHHDFQPVTKVWSESNACLGISERPRRVVIIEWKSYDIPEASESRARTWISNLAELLCISDKPGEFAALPCRGYFDDYRERTCGFVYELPEYIARYPTLQRRDLHLRRPISLSELLETKEEAIDLGIRFNIAKRLACSLYIMHASGFVHRDLKASSIIFLPDESGDPDGGPSKSRRKDLGKPFIIGFGYKISEESKLPSTSSAVRKRELEYHQHPEKLRRPYLPHRHGFDIYSLGLILLEVGLWQPLKPFAEETKWSSSNAEEFRSRLMRNWVPDLKGTCGGIYEAVVRECLSLGYSETERESAVEKTLCWDVAAKLNECNA